MDKVFDICVIGSGPAGAFAARELADNGKNVVVIEAGNDDVNSNIDNIIDIENSNIPGALDFGFSQQVGGSSNLWAGGLVELDEVDFVRREEFHFNGWPFEKSELDKYYRKVDKYITKDPQTNKTFSLDNSCIEAKLISVLKNPFVTTKLIQNIENITIFKSTMAVKLVFNSSCDTEFLQVLDIKNNNYKKIYAKKFIIAAGTLTNTRILLHSLSGIKNKLPELYDNIGKYFSTHPKADMGIIKLYKSIDYNNALVSINKEKNCTTWYQFGLHKDLLLATHTLNHSLRFTSLTHQRASKLFNTLLHILSKISFIKSGKFATIISKLGIYIFKTIDVFNFNNSKNLSIRAFFDQKASKENYVGLSEKKSKHGLPLATIHYSFDEDDWKNVEKYLELFSKELQELGIGEVKYHRQIDNFIGIHSHFIGGTIIGDSVTNSVVDKNLKVHGFSNLYVSGPSVFPSFGYANPFYSIAALSLRIGEHLKYND
jgi:choline dehydrogenase-like flavoprotein